MVNNILDYKHIFLVSLVLAFYSWTNAYTTSDLLKDSLDPRISYKTLETDYFKIHFDQKYIALAHHLYTKVDSIHAAVVRECGCDVKEKTHIVLVGRTDGNSVFTFVYPHNQIFLNVGLPSFEVGLNEFSDWYEWVLVHEYVHIVHLNCLNDSSPAMKSIFGNWYRPNLLRPAWLKEGLAVLAETNINKVGRGGSTIYRMMLRTAYNEKRLESDEYSLEKNLDTMSNFEETSWPWTLRPYVFGYMLVDQLSKTAQNLGLHKYQYLLEAPTSYWSADDDGLAQKLGYKDLKSAWSEAIAENAKISAHENGIINKEKLTDIEYLSSTGYYYFSPIMTNNGEALYSTFDSPGDSPKIVKLDLSDSSHMQTEVVLSRSSGAKVSVSKSGRFLAYDQVAHQERYSVVSDIYIYDLKLKKIISISPGMHLREPDIHPNGKELVFVQNVEGKTKLLSSDTNWKNIRVLVDDVGYRRISLPKFSPDGEAILFSITKENSGGEDIWLWRNGQLNVIVEDSSFKIHPSWSKDGKSIFYASDRSGVFNIYEVNLENQEVSQLTHLIGGAFSPVIDQDKKWIYFVSYRGHGYDLARFRYDLSIKKPANEQASFRLISIDPTSDIAIKDDSKPYTETISGWPHYLHPSLLFKPKTIQAGITFGSVDALFFHHYELQLKYDSLVKQVIGSLFWFRNLSFGALEFKYDRDLSPVYRQSYLQESNQAAFKLNVPHGIDQNNLFYRYGAFVQSITEQSRSNYWGASVGIGYDTEHIPLGYTEPQSGFRLDASIKSLNEFETNRREAYILGLTSAQHIQIAAEQILHTRFFGSTYLHPNQEFPQFKLGGRASFPYTLDSEFVFYGYPINSLQVDRVGLFDFLYSFQRPQANKMLFNFPIFLGRPSVGVRIQSAVFEKYQKTEFASSIGLEVSHHLITFNVIDLDSTLGMYLGDPAKGGETQFYFAIKGSK